LPLILIKIYIYLIIKSTAFQANPPILQVFLTLPEYTPKTIMPHSPSAAKTDFNFLTTKTTTHLDSITDIFSALKL